MQQPSRNTEIFARCVSGNIVAVLTVIIAWALIMGWPGAAQAAATFQPNAPANGFVQPDRRVGRMINLNQAVRIVREESGGKVLSAKSVRSPNGSLRHHVRVLVDGQRVTTFVVDQQGRLQRPR